MPDTQQFAQDKTLSAAPPIIALNLTRTDKGNTIAPVTLLFPRWEGLRIHGVLWGKKRDGSEWVLPPSQTWAPPTAPRTAPN